MILPAHTKPHTPLFPAKLSREDSTSDEQPHRKRGESVPHCKRKGWRPGLCDPQEVAPRLPHTVVRGWCRAQALCADLENQAKHFHKAEVPDFYGRAQAGSGGRAILYSWMTSGGCWCVEAALSLAQRLPAAPRSRSARPQERCSRNTGVWRKRKPHDRRVTVSSRMRGADKGSEEGRKRTAPEPSAQAAPVGWRQRAGPGLATRRRPEGEAGLGSRALPGIWGAGGFDAASVSGIFVTVGRNKRHQSGSPGTKAVELSSEPTCAKDTAGALPFQESPVTTERREGSPATAEPQRATCERSPKLTARSPPWCTTPEGGREHLPLPGPLPGCTEGLPRPGGGFTGQRRPPRIAPGRSRRQVGSSRSGSGLN